MTSSDQGYAFDTKHDRYPVAAHLILRNGPGHVLLLPLTRQAGPVVLGD